MNNLTDQQISHLRNKFGSAETELFITMANYLSDPQSTQTGQTEEEENNFLDEVMSKMSI